MKSKNGPKIALFVEICLTLTIMLVIAFTSFNNVEDEIVQSEEDLAYEYNNLINCYKTDFRLMTSGIKRQIKADISFEEMEEYLQKREVETRDAIGEDIYDGFSMTYKGGYAKSWKYGDYSKYNPASRRWYQMAQEADGDIAVTAPYTTYLDTSHLMEDEYIILSIVQKYNDGIYFCYDLKTTGLNGLLSNRYSRYDGSFGLLYDANGYILSSSEEGFYCHNVHKSDDMLCEEIVRAIKETEQNPGKIMLRFVKGELKFVCNTKDHMGNYYYISFPFFSIVKR